MLGSLSLGIGKKLSDGERLRRSEAMTAMNKNKKPTVKSIPAKKISPKNQPGVVGSRPAEFAGSRSVKQHPESPGAEEQKPAAKSPTKSEPLVELIVKPVVAVSPRKADDPFARIFKKIPAAAKPDESFRMTPQQK